MSDDKKSTSNLKRVAFYLFYDKDGIVDDYIPYKLEQLKKHIDKLIVISNSNLTKEARLKLEISSDVVIARENFGFDVWGYKEGLEYLGDEKYDYDEAIFLNYTFSDQSILLKSYLVGQKV